MYNEDFKLTRAYEAITIYFNQVQELV